MSPACGQEPGRRPWLTLLVLALVLAGAFLDTVTGSGAAFSEAALYRRESVAAGAWWRLLTGNLVHLDGPHLLWNAGAWLVLAGAYEKHPRGGPLRLALHAGAGCLSVGLWLWWLEPQVAWYGGLSGMLNGLFAGLALLLWRDRDNPLFLLLPAACAVKIAAELVHGDSLLTDLATPTLVSAHLAGFLCGLLVQSLPAVRGDRDLHPVPAHCPQAPGAV